MKVSYSKGVATHTDPESCVRSGNRAGEALTGARAGQVLSRERKSIFGGPTASSVRKATWNRSLFARAFPPPRGRRPCARTEVTYTGAGRSRLWPWMMVHGPRCESGRNTTAMYGDGKSDRLIVAVKRSNKDDGAPSLAESVEPSSLTKGNSFQLTKYWTQCRRGP